MGKLNQVIAVISGKKAKATQVVTECYHKMQKSELFGGISRTYAPKDEDGERLPPESKSVQSKVSDLSRSAIDAWTEMWDVVATQDWANCSANADVEVDGKTILTKVPVTHLLFLEKQLNDVKTFITKLPTLDPAELWTYNQETDSYSTLPAETTRTKKVPKAFVKAPATKEHPAQVETFHEDVLAGYWKTIKFSGAITAKQKNEMLERVHKLHEAVVKAREEANSIVVGDKKVGKPLFDYIFGRK